VADVRLASPATAARLEKAFDAMQARTSRPLLEEFEEAARPELDDATLELLGVSDASERAQIRADLYAEMTRLYREIRAAEVEMQKFRRITARRDKASPRTIAEEIWEEFDKSQIRVFPLAFLPPGENTESVNMPTGQPKVLDDLFDRGAVQVNGEVVRLGSKARAEFAAKIAELGHTGPWPVPLSDRACERALEAYRRYEAHTDAKFRELAAERSADSEVQARIVRELWKLLLASGRYVTPAL